jgi:hypothetical protein
MLAECYRPRADLTFVTFTEDRSAVNFPFEPKSTTYLRQGQYWCFQLSNGRFACGAVLARTTLDGKLHRTMFLGGLLNWTGSSLPTPIEMKSVGMLQSGFMHVKAIQHNGREVLGELDEAFESLPEVEYTGLTVDGPSLWGVAYVRALAEHNFGNPEWSDQELQKLREK